MKLQQRETAKISYVAIRLPATYLEIVYQSVTTSYVANRLPPSNCPACKEKIRHMASDMAQEAVGVE